MITVKTKIESKDLEKEFRYIESISNDKKSFLDLPNPNEKQKSTKKASFHPESQSYTEEI